MKRFLVLLLVIGLALVLVSCGAPRAAAPSQPKAASIKITSAPVLLTKAGQTAQLQATVYDSNGNAMKGIPIAWKSSDSSSVTVNSTGLVTSRVAVGSAIVTASASGLSALALVPIAQLAPSSVIVPKALVTNEKVNSNTSLTLTLENQGVAAKLIVGDIIVSDAGILARITSITPNGATLTVQATPVTLDDAFSALHLTGTSTSVPITTSITPQGVRVSSPSPTVTPQSLDLSKVHCTVGGSQPVSLNITGGSFSYSMNYGFVPDLQKLPGGHISFSASTTLKPRVTIVTPTLTFNKSVSSTVTCTVDLIKRIPIVTGLTFFGIVSIDGDITPVVGFTVETSVSGSVTVTGPSITGAGADATFGVAYNSGSWSTTHTATRVPGTYTPPTFPSLSKASLAFTIAPFFEPKLGFSLDFGWIRGVGIDFATPEVSVPFKLNLALPFDPSKPTYIGPEYDAGLDLSVGFGIALTGLAGDAFHRMDIGVSLASVSIPIFQLPFLHSPQPAVTPNTTTVTHSVTLSSTVPKRYQGDRLEFWGYATGGSTATKLATTTVHSDGSASTSWTPTSSDNGSMHIFAALYGDAFKALNYPYATPATSRPTLTINTTKGSTAPAIASFQASPTSITGGQSSTLSWSVSGTSPITLSIDHGVGDVTGKTSITVTPTTTTTYTLTASNAANSATAQASVTVSPAPTPPSITSFTASPNPVPATRATTFSWAISGGSGSPSCTLDAGDGSAPITVYDCTSYASLNHTYASDAGSPYTATLTIDGSNVSKTTSVTVNAAPPSISGFQVGPNPVVAGHSTTFTWTITGATGTVSCTFYPADGSGITLKLNDCGNVQSQSFTYTAVGTIRPALTVQGGSTQSTSVTVDPGDGGFLSSVSAISGGELYTSALRSDGTVWSWGLGQFGVLGDGVGYQNYHMAAPVQAAGLNNVTSVSAGADHALALDASGGLWAWGANANPTPIKLDGISNLTAVAAGNGYSLVLKQDGTAWAWGGNGSGQLGDGTTTRSATPVQVQGLSSVTDLAASYSHSLAIEQDGTVWAWGSNAYGQLGNGTRTDSDVPVQVQGLSNVTAVAGAYARSLALEQDGSVWEWGQFQGADHTRPVQVAGLSNVVAIAVGWSHGLALDQDGTVWAWGYNTVGQLGGGPVGDGTWHAPAQVSGVSHVVAVTAGQDKSVALEQDGTVWTWGSGAYGQLGNGTTTRSNSPVQVLDGP